MNRIRTILILFVLVMSTKVSMAQLSGFTTDAGKPHILVKDADIDANETVTWYKTNVYILEGFVYVEDGATLTIQPGTVIKSKEGQALNASALIISRGAKIYAEGTPTEPIIFTSVLDSVALPDYDPNDNVDYTLDRGLWGGVALLGKAPNNVGTDVLLEGLPDDPRGYYGGTDATDNSGVFRYVSIRYSGTVVEANKELQGLSGGSLGSGTTIEYVESFNSADDGYEFFGGTVNTKYLISAFADDDAFDYDQGFSGNHQFWFGIQAADAGDRVGEFDSGDDPNFTASPKGSPVVYNATFIGGGENSDNSKADAMFIYKEYGAGEQHNGVYGEYPGLGVKVDSAAGETSYSRFEAGELVFEDNLWYGLGKGLADRPAVESYIMANNTMLSATPLKGIARVHDDATKLDPRPAVGSAAFSGAPLPPSNGFFSQVDYYGAFSPNNNWAAGWTALYQSGIIDESGVVTSIKEEKKNNSKPSSITLHQNYPNPFNPTTNISFELPDAQKVTIQVYDMLGRMVATLANQTRYSAGENTVSFDASNLSSGVYIYRLSTVNAVVTRKMTLIK